MSSRPLPLFPPSGGDPWRLPHPAPTTLLALWPGSKPPLQELVAEALIEHSPESVLVGELSSPPEGALWTLVVDVPAPIDSRVILFAEAAHPDGAADLDEACRACRWVVGVELLLPKANALRALVASMRMAHAITPGTPAILDVASSTWHGGESLRRWFVPDDADPPAWILWSAHAVCRDRDHRPGSPAWIRSAGLWRCGLPELEILELPAEFVQAGVALVHAVAELLLEAPPPAPGVRWSIGQEIDVALVPWREVAPLLPAESPGSLPSRGLPPEAVQDPAQSHLLGHPLGGVRAVICGPEPRGTYRALWSWPEAAIRRLAAGDALVQQSASAARRNRRVAQRTLPQLVEAVQQIAAMRGEAALEQAGAPRVLVAAAFDPLVGRFVQASGPAHRATLDDSDGEVDADHGHRGEAEGHLEHRWIAIQDVGDGAFSGTILSGADGGGNAGATQSATVSFAAVTDWQVMSDGGVITPDEVEWLSGSLRRWLGVEEGSAP